MFHGEKEGDILSTLTLRNIRDAPVAYKVRRGSIWGCGSVFEHVYLCFPDQVKTTAPLQYKVRPNLNTIDAKSVAKIQVFLTQGSLLQYLLPQCAMLTCIPSEMWRCCECFYSSEEICCCYLFLLFLFCLFSGSKVSGQDKFLVQTYSFPDSSSVPKTDDLPRFWKTLSPTDISEHKYVCGVCVCALSLSSPWFIP